MKGSRCWLSGDVLFWEAGDRLWYCKVHPWLRQGDALAVMVGLPSAGIFIGARESGTGGCVVLVHGVLICRECIRVPVCLRGLWSLREVR